MKKKKEKFLKKYFKNLKFVWEYAKKSKGLFIISFIFNLLSSVILIILPIISARVIFYISSYEYERLILISLALLVAHSLNSILFYVSTYFSSKAYDRLFTSLQTDLGRNILKLNNKCFDENGSGVFIQRITSDSMKFSNIFRSLENVITSIFEEIGIYVAVFLINKYIFLLLILKTIVTFWIEKIRTNKMVKKEKEIRKINDNVTSIIGELVHGVRDIKMLNSEEDFMYEFSNRITTYQKKNREKILCGNLLFNLENICSYVFDFIFILLLIYLMSSGLVELSFGLVLYNYTRNSGYSSFYLGHFLENVNDFNLSCERILEILDSKKYSKEKFGKKHLDKIEGNFEFKNVCFSYDNNKVLSNLSFKINSNETVAFVGKSGAGKTTIFNLLCKMYDADSGKITIDGVDINELDKDSIRGNITVISQNPYIFNMTIRDNFRLVKNDLTDDEMINACKIACLSDYIESLPDKYDTLIGEGGINLSGGQKQRLAIARALIQNTKIILFDEATSALDNETQSKIQNAIENMNGDYTILIIAHRLSTIKNSNRILYLEDGKILCEGTHSELLKNCSEYKNLYNSEEIEK